MWYFTWILGAGLAVGFGILNGMWHEFHLGETDDGGPAARRPTTFPAAAAAMAALATPGVALATPGVAAVILGRPAARAAWTETLRDGTPVRIRRIQAGDVSLERDFIEGLSAQARRFRFLDTMRSPGDALLHKLTTLDAASEDAFVALVDVAGDEREIGVARFSALSDGTDCEFAVAVSDDWQDRGLGRLLMRHLIDSARSRGIRAMHSSDASANDRMRHFAQHLGLRHERDPDDATQVLYTLDLEAASV